MKIATLNQEPSAPSGNSSSPRCPVVHLAWLLAVILIREPALWPRSQSSAHRRCHRTYARALLLGALGSAGGHSCVQPRCHLVVTNARQEAIGTGKRRRAPRRALRLPSPHGSIE